MARSAAVFRPAHWAYMTAPPTSGFPEFLVVPSSYTGVIFADYPPFPGFLSISYAKPRYAGYFPHVEHQITMEHIATHADGALYPSIPAISVSGISTP